MATRLFDLNIEEVLENWEVPHAIREVISNALDERTLSGTAEIEIRRDRAGRWHVRDHGRGLQIEHFTLNENEEKLNAPGGVIGKFGVGLKDALATFHRRGIEVVIRSRYGTFTLQESEKHSFAGISTLHVVYDDDPTGVDGTEFELSGVTDAQMAEAKGFFLAFNDERVLESTSYGEVLKRSGDTARVYINGVFANDEANFLFSYNVTNLTDAMRKRLNRERLNVGRTTYAERIKSILKSATSDAVIDALMRQILERSKGGLSDELGWIEISQAALTHLHERREVIFVTEQELQRHPDLMDHARADGLQIVTVSAAEKVKLVQQAEAGGVATRTLETYVREFNQSFSYTFVDPDDLSSGEKEVFALTPELFALIGIHEDKAPNVLVSETMRLTSDDTEGVWDGHLEAIVVKRDRLRSPLRYAATLLHEAAHATTGTIDATREFEAVLTHYLGKTSTAALKDR